MLRFIFHICLRKNQGISMRQEILRMQNISKYSHLKQVLYDFHMNLYAGEVLGIIIFHSEKSDLFDIIRGVESADTGQIFFDEELVSPAWLTRSRKIKLIRDEPALIPTLNVLENIYIIRKRNSHKLFIPWNLLKKQLEDCFTAFNIHIDFSRRVSTLTRAEQHMIEIVKAYILGAQVIILDNTMAQYDNVEIKKLRHLINSLKSKGISFIVIGYQLSSLQRYANRILFLVKGRTIKIMESADTLGINENDLLLEGIQADSISKTRRQPETIVFEARHISTRPGEDISFQIHQGEIAVILDLHNLTNANIINAALSKTQYSGRFLMNGQEVRNVAKSKKRICIADYASDDKIVYSLDLTDNLCLSAFPHISFFGFVNIRAKKQITKDFLEVYSRKNIAYKFDIGNLSQPESMYIYLQRLLIQKWRLLICVNPEVLFSYETGNVIKEQLRRMTENGRSICLFASTVEPYINLADHFYLADKGKIIGRYTYRELQKHI